MAKYAWLPTDVWRDEGFRRLGMEARECFFFILLHPHMTGLGGLQISIPGLTTEMRLLGWMDVILAQVNGMLRALTLAGFLIVDADHCLIVVPGVLRATPPVMNMSSVRAWLDDLERLPACPLRAQLAREAWDRLVAMNADLASPYHHLAVDFRRFAGPSRRDGSGNGEHGSPNDG